MYTPAHRWLKLLCLIGMLALWHSTCFAQTERGLYRIQNYSAKDYKSVPQNWCVVQDPRGILYFGNNVGVLEFDGVTWKIIHTLNETHVRSLAVDERGRIFVGSQDDFGYLSPNEGGAMTYHSLAEKLTDAGEEIGDVWGIYVLKNGVVFRGRTALYYHAADSITKVGFTNPILKSVSIGNEVIVSVESEGLFSYDGIKLSPAKGLGLLNTTKAIHLVESTPHPLLMVSGAGFYHYTGDTLQMAFPFADDEIKAKATSAIALHDGTIAIGTFGRGLFIQDRHGNPIKLITDVSGLQDLTIYSGTLDTRGNLWLALDKGITKIDINSPLTFYNAQLGLNGRIEAITRHKGRLYVATNTGIARLNVPADYKLSELPKFEYITGTNIESWDIFSYQYNGDTILLYTNNNGLFELTADDKPKLIAECYPYQIHQSTIDPTQVFVGLEPGLLNVSRIDGKWINRGKVDGIDAVARFVEEDSNGHLWMGTDNEGLVSAVMDYSSTPPRVSELNWYDTTAGLPEGTSLPFHAQSWSLIGTNSGLFNFSEAGKIAPHAALSELFGEHKNDAFIRLSTDMNGNLWVVSIANTTNSSSVSSVSVRKDGGYQWLRTPFADLNGFFVFAMHHDADGVTWMGGPEGLFRYDGGRVPSYEAPYNTLIRKVTIGEDSLAYEGAAIDEKGRVTAIQTESFMHVLPYLNNSLSISFASNSYEDEAQNQYSYFMDGFDRIWSPWKSESKAVYTNLPEGDYVFHVKSRNKFGIEGQEATYKITILPPWYRTWWAYLTYVLAFIGVVLGAVNLSTKGLQSIIREKTAEVVKQKEEIEFKNQNLEHANEEILKQKHVIEEKNKDILDSINYAEKIQRAILPQDELRTKILPQSFVLFRPKDIVSGDFYWMAEKAGRSFFTAADCTGHGVPGAFMSMIGTSLLNETVNERGIITPGLILDEVKAGVIKALKQGISGESKDGMDAALCSLDQANCILEFAGGNNPVYIIREDNEPLTSPEGTPLGIEPYIESGARRLYEIKPNKMPIAYYPGMDKPFTNHRLKVKAGDHVYLSSDGFPDQFGGPKGKKFMYKQFKELLVDLSTSPIQAQRELLEKSFLNWLGKDYEQIDDVCIIGVKV